MKTNYLIAGEIYTVDLEKTAGGVRITIGDEIYEIENIEAHDQSLKVQLAGNVHQVDWVEENSRKRWLAVDGKSYLVEKPSSTRRRAGQTAVGGNQVLAPMPGQVREVLAAEGDEVTQGQTLLLLEAMKMEIRIQAPRDGKIVKLPVDVGQQVNKDELLAEVE